MKRQLAYSDHQNSDHHHNNPYSGASAASSHRNAYSSQWQWDRERDREREKSLNESNRFSSPRESQGTDGMRSYYQGPKPDAKLGLESQVNKEERSQRTEQDMEVGFDEKMSSLTFEDLERKFLDEITALSKEQSDAEDRENARHRERIVEINVGYQEKLTAARVKQANKREELLRKESQARLIQYQQVGMDNYPSSGMQDSRGYGAMNLGGATSEVHRPYATTQFDSYRDRPQYAAGGRAQGTDGRVPYPEGRAYGSSGARYY